MKITYTTSVADLEVFYRYIYGTRPEYGGIEWNRLIWSGFVMLLIVLVAILLRWSWLSALFVVIPCTLGIYLLLPVWADSIFTKFFRNPETCPDTEFPGQYELTIDEESLHEHAKFYDLYRRWESVCGVEETPTHAFIMTGRSRAIVVPKGSVVTGDLSAFLVEVQARSANKTLQRTPTL